MTKLLKFEKLTNTSWLNLFFIKYKNSKNKIVEWYFASRRENPLLKTEKPNAVVIIPFIQDKIVLIKQYRASIQNYLIECPAGFMDPEEKIIDTARRELKEETGLKIIAYKEFDNVLHSCASSTDDSVSYVFAKCGGIPTSKGAEDTEEIEIFTLTREEVNEFLKKETLFSDRCWLILQAYINGFDWFKEL